VIGVLRTPEDWEGMSFECDLFKLMFSTGTGEGDNALGGVRQLTLVL